MNPTPALTDEEIDELDIFLLSDEMPDNCMDISMLDGFFASLVLNPRLIMPGEYLPLIWDMERGEDPPAFESLEQANRILQLVMRYYNSVLDSISSNDFAPLFYTLEQDDDSEFFDAEGWCEGFMCGVFLFPEPWKDVFENHPGLLSPMVLLGTEHGWAELDKAENNRQITQEAYESIAAVVELLYEHFGAQREAEIQKRQKQPGINTQGMRVEAIKIPGVLFNVGRNDECPCGSGKKFKKCCGVPPTLH